MKDYYSTLGVSKGANQEEIKKAFRKLAHQHHPDKEGGDEAKFKEINEAYQTLSDQTKREQYDHFGKVGDQSGGGFAWEDFSRQGGVNFDMGDLSGVFGDLFGMGRRSGGRSRAQQGNDITMEVTLDFRDAVFGTKKGVSLYKQVVCKVCGGSQAQPRTSITTCTHCGGRGEVGVVKQTIFGSVQALTPCTHCKGNGKYIEKPCKECRGNGVAKAEERLDVTIPAGINNGETLRMKGQGEAGNNGGPYGDLYITIRVKSDKRFRREEYDIHVDLPIRFTQSALGDTVTIETLDGTLDVKIPPGTQSGTAFRFANLGVPYLHKKGRGEFFVTVTITTPSHLSRKQRELLEQLKKEQL